jgi:Holliday junction DNA helicase RuvA
VIGSLRGVLLDRSSKGDVLVEVGGVGYRVQVPTSAHRVLGELGSPVFLHVHTHVREDALVLYGFPSADERVAFEALLGTHGIGPAVALAILSVHSPAALVRAVATDDVDALTLVPGIGKKTAARLLLELKSRLDLELPSEVSFSVVGSGAGGASSAPSARNEVRNALAALGYGADEVREAVRLLPDEGAVEDLLRSALRSLSGAPRIAEAR